MLVADTPIQLRPYQEEALEALWAFWSDDRGKHPLIVLPTGAGKSLTMAELCRRAMGWPGTRICVLAHRGELIQQNAEAIEGQVGQRVGIFAAGLGSRETEYPITVASIQSIYARAPQLDPFDLIIIDEAHRIPPQNTTRYRRFLDEAALQNPDIKFIGFTATPFRMGAGRLDRGEDALFDAVVYSAEISDLVQQGYLSDVISRGGVRKIDTSGVHIRGGEYVAGELARAADDPDVTRAAVSEIVGYGIDRRGWLIFAAGIKHAEHVRDEVLKHGITCSLVTGETGALERARTIQRFKDRQVRCLVSVDVFLEGFNAPHVDLIGMMRPTKSPVLYIQAVGRGLRTAPGKTDCLLLDYAGVVAELGPIDQIRIREPGPKRDDEDREAPAKECPECRLIVPAGAHSCPCGYEWPARPPDRYLQANAFGGAVLSHQNTQELVAVAGVRLSRWEPADPSKPDTLLVTYRCGLREVREWVCPEHTGYARTMFEHRCNEWGIVPPATIEEAIAAGDKIRVPTSILVRPQRNNPRYLEVLRRFYE